LKNIQNFVEKFNIIEQEQHKIWINDNFDFPSEMRLIDIVYTNQMEQMEKIKDLNKIQMELLNLDINNEELNIDMLIDEDDETNSINDNKI
jgi:hypothetical protein